MNKILHIFDNNNNMYVIKASNMLQKTLNSYIFKLGNASIIFIN